MIGGQDVFEFIRGVRLGAEREPHRFIPVILMSAHTASDKIALARDCGINFVLAKPVSPKVVMDRMLWVAKGGRQFVVTPTYAGPDRRFRQGSPPRGLPERRQNQAKRPHQMHGRSL
jgi:DNA-binding response OmpR family regulator